MALNCRIFRDEKGDIDFVQTPDGNRSKLFDTLADMTGGNKEAALNLYALTELEDFKDINKAKLNSFKNNLKALVKPSALKVQSIEEADYVEVSEDRLNWESSIAEELKKVNNISDTQADTLEKVAEVIYENIAKRSGKSVADLKRSMQLRTVENVQEFLKDIPNSISTLFGLSDQMVRDFSSVTEEDTTVDYQTVQPKYIKNLGIASDNYIMSSLLDLEDTFGFLGYTTKLSSLGNQEKITAEINRRLLDIRARAENANDFYIQELSPSFLQSSLRRAVTEAEKESIQALIDGDSYAVSQNIKNLQGIQRANLVSSLDYIVPSSDYSAEFKYMMVALILKGNVAKDVDILDDNDNVIRTIPGEKAKRNSMTVGNHQELSSMVLPNVYEELKNGSDTHPIKLIDKHTDKSYITREETWDIIKDRIEEETENGYWVKFNRSSEEGDIKALSLVSKKVAKVMSTNPWCTGGGMASSYLPKGDFYLFLDKTLEPKITIRYQGSDISELKGTDAGQALSKEQADEAYKKLPKIENGLNYANNIKTSRIYHKLLNNEDFSKQDLQDYFDTMGVELETYDNSKRREYIDLRDEFDKVELYELNKKYKIYSRIRNFVNIDLSLSKDSSESIIEGEFIIGDINISADSSTKSEYLPKSFTIPNNVRIGGTLSINFLFNDIDIIIGDNVKTKYTEMYLKGLTNIKIGDNFGAYNKLEITTPPKNEKSSIEIGDNYDIGEIYVRGSGFDEKKLIDFNIGKNGILNRLELKNLIVDKNLSLPKLNCNYLVLNNCTIKDNFNLGEGTEVNRKFEIFESEINGSLNIGDNSNFDRFYLDKSIITNELSIGENCKFKNNFTIKNSSNLGALRLSENVDFEDVLDIKIDDFTISNSTIPESTKVRGQLRITSCNIAKDFILPSGVEDLVFDSTKIENGFSIPESANYVLSLSNVILPENFTLLNNNMLKGINISGGMLADKFKLPNQTEGYVAILDSKNIPSGVIPEGMYCTGRFAFSRCTFKEGFTMPKNVRLNNFQISGFSGDLNADKLPKSFSIPDSSVISYLLLKDVILGDNFSIGENSNIPELHFTNSTLPENFTIQGRAENSIVKISDCYINPGFKVKENSNLEYLEIKRSNVESFLIEPSVSIKFLYFEQNYISKLKISKGSKISSGLISSIKELEIEPGTVIGKGEWTGSEPKDITFSAIGKINVGDDVVFEKGFTIKDQSFLDSTFGNGIISGGYTSFRNVLQMQKIEDITFLRTVYFYDTDIDFVPKRADYNVVYNFNKNFNKNDKIKFEDNSIIKPTITINNKLIGGSGLNIGKNVTFEGSLKLIDCEIKCTEEQLIPETTKINGKLNFNNVETPPAFDMSYYKNRGIEVKEGLDIDLQDRRGAIVRTEESTLILLDKNNADVTTPIHELTHKYEDVLTAQEVKIVEDWSGHKKGTKQFREAFAKGAEKYIYEGSTFNGDIDGIFKRLKDWFFEVVKDAIAYFGDINELNPDIKTIYSKMLLDSKNKEAALAKPKKAKDYEGRSTKATTESGVSYLSESGDLDYDTGDGVQWDGDKINGVFRSVKGIWNKSKDLQFTGTTRVKNAADVAEIMSLLENKSVEHAFAVHTDAKGKSHIQFLSVGGSTGTVIDPGLVLSGVNKFKSKKVYLVHNHPSGNLTPSAADSEITSRVASGLRELNISLEHVIMDTYSKQYTILDEFGLTTARGVTRVETEGEKEKLTTYTLNEQEVLSEPLGKVAGAEDAANFIQQFRFSAMPKNAALILDQNNKIIGNYVFQDGIEYEELTSFIGEFGIAKNVIFYGNQDNLSSVKDISRKLKNFSITVLDHIVTASNNDIVKGYYTSAQNSGLLSEVQEKYGTNSVEDNRVEEPTKDFKNLDLSKISNLIKIPQTIETTELDKIPRGDTFQERLSPEYFDKLKEDIKKYGIKEPITLQYYVKDNAVRLLEGHHRLKIAKDLGIKEVPVKINVVWGRSIAERNSDIQGIPMVSPPVAINKEQYLKRFYEPSNVNVEELGYKNKFILEAYAKAKKDGSNNNLVEAVENLLGGPIELPAELKANIKQQDILKNTESKKSNVRTPVVDMNGARVFAANRVNPITGEDTGQIELQLLESDEKGKGNARRAAEAFLKYTDSIGKDVYIAVSSRDGGITEEDRLGDFYRSLGFRNTSAFEMVRKARPVSPKGFDKNGEPDASTVLQFNAAKVEALTNEEILDVHNSMVAFGLTSSKELYTTLMKALSNKGIVTFSRVKLQRSKMFNSYEIDKIMSSPEIQTTIRETLLKLRNTEDFSAEYNPIFAIPASSELTMLGKQKSSNPFETEREVAEAVSNLAPEEIEANLEGQIANKYAQDKTFKELVDNINKTTKSVVVKTIVDGQLVDKLPGTIGALANTITEDYNGDMSEDIVFLNNDIRKETWEENRTLVAKVLNKIKKSAIQNGIDLKDLSTKAITHSREDILDLLDAMENLLEDPSEENLVDFTNMYNEIFDITEPVTELIQTDNKSDIFVDTDATEYELFRDHGLIKKQDGVYRVTKDQDLANMYENMLQNIDVIPTEISTIAELRDYVQKTTAKLELPDFQVDTELLEKMVLYKMYFGFPLTVSPKVFSTDGLMDITMDADLLKEDFVRDFNKFLLETDNRYFEVTEKGIELISKDEISKAEAILTLPEDIKESLAQYDILSKSLNLGLESKEKAEQQVDSQKEKRLYVTNNPQTVKKLKGNYSYLEDGVMATKNETETFVRTPVGVFEMVYQFGNVKFYNKLPDVDVDYKLTDIEKPLSDIDFSKYQHLETSPEIFKEAKKYYTKKELEQINQDYFNCK